MAETLELIQSELVGRTFVRKADETDLPIVWGIINACSQQLTNQGLTHWSDHYTEDMVAKMIKKLNVYLAVRNEHAVGTMTFDQRPPKYYIDDGYLNFFSNPDAKAGYIMAMGVLPDFQNSGIANDLIQFAFNSAERQGIESLRLDCRDEVPGLAVFYEKRGFVKVGVAPIVEGEGESYWLMEKRLVQKD